MHWPQEGHTEKKAVKSVVVLNIWKKEELRMTLTTVRRVAVCSEVTEKEKWMTKDLLAKSPRGGIEERLGLRLEWS